MLYPRLRLLTCVALFTSTAFAQFNYDFDGTTETYFTYETEGIAFLTDTNTRNVFNTSGTSVDDDDAILFYKNNTQLNQDWYANLTVYMPSNVSGAVLNSAESVELGISLFVPATGDSGSTIDLRFTVDNPSDNPANNRGIFAEYEDKNAATTVASALTIADQLITLSLNFDSSSGLLTSKYGATTLSTHDLFDASTGWDITSESWVSIALNGGSEGIDELTSDQPSFVNFTTSVVPEPASASALMGAFVLGCVLFGRRRRA